MLFNISGDDVRALLPRPFRDRYREEHLQHWADESPHLLNRGQAMLSLGTEIETLHGHYIDNLFIDGNGCLVVAELKRGKSPREVMAQAVDYGAYVSRLDWDQIDAICRKRHDGASLDEKYQSTLGFGLDKSAEPEHRLLIVAESFEPSVEDAAAYLNNIGVRLTLLGFSYFELTGAKLFDVRVVLGEIPEQKGQKAKAASSGEASATDGYRNWLSRTLRDELPRFAAARGVDVTLGRGKTYLSFIPQPWPYSLGDCHFGIGINARNVGLYFSYLTARVPDDLHAKVREAVFDGQNPYDPDRLSVAKESTTLSHSTARPELGQMEQVTAVLEETFRMVDLFAPIVRSVSEGAA